MQDIDMYQRTHLSNGLGQTELLNQTQFTNQSTANEQRHHLQVPQLSETQKSNNVQNQQQNGQYVSNQSLNQNEMQM